MEQRGHDPEQHIHYEHIFLGSGHQRFLSESRLSHRGCFGGRDYFLIVPKCRRILPGPMERRHSGRAPSSTASSPSAPLRVGTSRSSPSTSASAASCRPSSSRATNTTPRREQVGGRGCGACRDEERPPFTCERAHATAPAYVCRIPTRVLSMRLALVFHSLEIVQQHLRERVVGIAPADSVEE